MSYTTFARKNSDAPATGSKVSATSVTHGLRIGSSHHAHEQEADRVASDVMSGGVAKHHWSLPHPGVTIASRETELVLRRADKDEWAKQYGRHTSYLVKPYEEYKAGLGEIKPTTAGGLTQNLGRPIKKQAGTGTPVAPEITMPVLREIYPGLAADADADPVKKKQAQTYLENLNQAFRIMKIDTVEAQANYLAHAFIESDQFRQFTESQGAVDQGAQKWMDDPTKVKIATGSLGQIYPAGGDINPAGNFEFIGRGPVQVTHKPEYVETIAMLEKTAEQYDKEAAAGGNSQAQASAQLAREAATAIKADPRQAANPRYTFLFTAAFMKKMGADVKVAGQGPGTKWTGADAASSWVAGGLQKKGSPQAQALVDKSAASDHIYTVLLREANKTARSAPSP